MKHFSIIVATNIHGGIGKNGTIPWKEKDDMKFFRGMTTTTLDGNKINAVIMGRITFESLKQTPLKDRVNIVVTSNDNYVSSSHNNLFIARSLDHALSQLENMNNIERIFVIGGQRLYEEAIVHPRCQNVYLNKIGCYHECDTFFPENKLKYYDLVAEKNLNRHILARMYTIHTNKNNKNNKNNKKIDL